MPEELHINMKNVSEELYKFILDEQVRLKLDKKSSVNLGTTVHIMLKDYKTCREGNNFIPQDHD